MQDEEKKTGGVTPTQEDAKQDATSKETVSDLGKADATVESESSGSGGTNEEMPSPDGQFDSPRGGAGPENEAGPM